MQRRKFFIASASFTAPLLSGCLGGSGDGSGSGADDENGGDSATEDTDDIGDTGDDGPDDSIENYDPEAVTRSFFEAWDENDQATMDTLSHPDGTAINNSADNVDHWSGHDIIVKETSVDIEDLDYFYYPSAAVTIRYDLVDSDGNEFPSRHQAILVVADGELLVYNLKEQFNEIQEGAPEGTCPPESSGDAEDLLPRTGEQFFQVIRRDSIRSALASYRGPDGYRYMVEISVHDSVAEAEEEELSESGFEFGDGRWSTETALLARHENTTIVVRGEREEAEDEVEALFNEAGCFSDDHIVDTTW